jgi:hypothetical protein
MRETVGWRKPPPSRWELPILMLAAWLAFISVPLGEGHIGISWDALNHHFYLGWTAEHPRFDRDFLAASYQALQFPYLYWPAYKLAVTGWSGAWAGAVLVSLNCLAVPPLWMMARLCMPGREWFEVAMRTLAVALAFMSGLIVSLFDSTSNDLYAAIPFVWAMAWGLEGLQASGAAPLSARRAVILSGLLAGVSVAFKLSNGFLAVLLPGLWLFSAGAFRRRVMNTVLGGVAAIAGFVLAYGYWGWQLWMQFGNPVYPFYDPWFAPLRAMLGWHQ